MEATASKKGKILAGTVSVLLFAPQLSLPLVHVDAYMLLLLIIGWRYIIKKSSGQSLLVTKIELFWMVILVVFLLAIIVQWANAEKYGFFAHLYGLEGRDEINLTFGYASRLDRSLPSMLNIKILSLVALGLFISTYIGAMSAEDKISFLRRCIYTCTAIQLFFLMLYFLGLDQAFVALFIQERLGDHFASGTSVRLNMIRIPGGFSEPSFMAVILFAVVSAMLLCAEKNRINITKRQFWSISGCLLFLAITTVSLMNGFVLGFFLLFFWRKQVGWISVNVAASICALTTLLLQFLSSTTLDSVIPDSLYSIAVRQIFVTHLETLSSATWMFGYGIGQVFNFPIFNNLILQLGAVGAMLFLLAFTIFGKRGVRGLCYVSLLISVAPNFSYSCVFVAMGIIAGALGREPRIRELPLQYLSAT